MKQERKWVQLPKVAVTLSMLLCIFATTAFAQKTVKGTVIDQTGLPVIGANVLEKGTTNGRITNLDGEFSLTVQDDATLVISYIGYITQEIPVKGKNEIKVTLEEDSETLEEVVVVGYGVQKKVNLTGSVATVSSEKLESRATTNLSSSLSGLATGVSVNQSSGKPGDDGASIQMRGLGSFNSSSPMVIVDGSEASISSVNSDDVESISFLKDAASAAIYGSRGANGVILITTKKGKKGQAPRITYSGIVTNSKMSGKAFRFEDNYAEYMEMANRWNTNRDYQAGTKYTQADIDEWREGLQKAANDPNGTDNPYGVPNFLAYPSTQWVDVLFRPSTSHKHNVSLTGGSENTSYLMSFNYLDNPGTLENTGIKSYQGRINLETTINKFLTVGTQTYATFDDREPGNTSFSYMFQNTPAMTPEYNGMYGVAVDGSSNNNLLATVVSTGGKYSSTRLNTTWYAKLNIIDGLTAEGRYNYQTLFNETETWSKTVDKMNFRTGQLYPGTASSQATTSRETTRYQNHTASLTVNYNKTFAEDHDLGVLLGTEQYYWQVKGFSATRTGLLDMTLPDFTAATDQQIPTVGGTAKQEYGVVSYFGRLNYAYKNRYLFEANFRRDGSSRFGPDNRWGTFPSFSAAWRINEEAFMENTRDIISNMKLRASWGKLGNTTSGYYDWQATYGSVVYSFGGNIYDGLRQGKIANTLLHWEASESTNIGIDLGFLNNRLNIEADWYNRTTKGILATPSIYMTMGTVSAPTTNTSDMRNRGIELSVRWTDKIKDFEYSISANFAYNQNKVVKYKGKLEQGWVTDENGNRTFVSNIGDVADYGNTIVVEDHMYNEHFLFERHKGNGNIYLADGVTPDPNGGPKDGMIRTKADLDWVRAMLDYRDADGNRVYDFNNQSIGQGNGLWYGELIYADVNGDGQYGTNNYDRVFTGKSTAPKYTYGLSISAAWKGIDLSMTWAGNAGMYRYIYERGFNQMSSSGWQEGTIVARNARNIFYYCDPVAAATDPN